MTKKEISSKEQLVIIANAMAIRLGLSLAEVLSSPALVPATIRNARIGIIARGRTSSQKVYAFVPQTRQWKRRIAHSRRQRVLTGILTFGMLKTLSASSKRACLMQYRRIIRDTLRFDRWLSPLKRSFQISFTVIALTAMGVAPAVVRRFSGIETHWTVASILFYLLLLALWGQVCGLPLRYLIQAQERYSGRFSVPFTVAMFLWAALTLLVSLVGIKQLMHTSAAAGSWRAPAASALFGFVLIWSTATLLTSLTVGFALLVARRRAQLQPASQVIVGTVALLAALEKLGVSGRLNDVQVKREFVKDLESIAHSIEREVFPSVPVFDIETHDWLRARMQGASRSIRHLKRWVLTPMPDTENQLMRRLADLIPLEIEGRWDQIELLDHGMSDEVRPRRRVEDIIAAALLGALPLALVLFSTKAALFGIPTFAFGALLIWLVFSIVTVVKPDASKVAFDIAGGLVSRTKL